MILFNEYTFARLAYTKGDLFYIIWKVYLWKSYREVFIITEYRL